MQAERKHWNIWSWLTALHLPSPPGRLVHLLVLSLQTRFELSWALRASGLWVTCCLILHSLDDFLSSTCSGLQSGVLSQSERRQEDISCPHNRSSVRLTANPLSRAELWLTGRVEPQQLSGSLRGLRGFHLRLELDRWCKRSRDPQSVERTSLWAAPTLHQNRTEPQGPVSVHNLTTRHAERKSSGFIGCSLWRGAGHTWFWAGLWSWIRAEEAQSDRTICLIISVVLVNDPSHVVTSVHYITDSTKNIRTGWWAEHTRSARTDEPVSSVLIGPFLVCRWKMFLFFSKVSTLKCKYCVCVNVWVCVCVWMCVWLRQAQMDYKEILNTVFWLFVILIIPLFQKRDRGARWSEHVKTWCDT